jgi:hypothetical protein
MFPLTDRATRDQRGREAFERMLTERGQTEEEFITESWAAVLAPKNPRI